MFTAQHRGGSGPPLVLLHGFTDTWRTWELVLPMLERHHDVLAPTLAGHAGGPPVDGNRPDLAVIDAVEHAMDAAGFGLAHFAGNSLGGYVAMHLAARGRARSVVALAPAGGASSHATLDHFRTMQQLLVTAAQHADMIASTPEGRRRATSYVTVNYEHIPPDLIAHQIRGAAATPAVFEFIDYAERHGWELEAEKITCPVRVVWGTEDRLLPWPRAAARYREWVPHAEWVELEGVGHCPQLDVPVEVAQLIVGFTGVAGAPGRGLAS